jgi:hypothetical protein
MAIPPELYRATTALRNGYSIATHTPTPVKASDKGKLIITDLSDCATVFVQGSTAAHAVQMAVEAGDVVAEKAEGSRGFARTWMRDSGMPCHVIKAAKGERETEKSVMS